MVVLFIARTHLQDLCASRRIRVREQRSCGRDLVCHLFLKLSNIEISENVGFSSVIFQHRR